MDDDTAYMELVKANNQGELLALEIGIHALATVNDKTKKGGGVRAYAAEIGKGVVSVTEWTKAASVYVFLSRTCGTNELHSKTSHLYEIRHNNKPLMCWLNWLKKIKLESPSILFRRILLNRIQTQEKS